MESKLRLEASLKDKMESKWRLDSPNGVQVALGERRGVAKWRFEAIFEGLMESKWRLECTSRASCCTSPF